VLARRIPLNRIHAHGARKIIDGRIMPNRRRISVILLAGLMPLLGLGPGQTEDYPSRPLRLIITTPAGSLVDVLGRLFAQDLGDRLGQTMVVDNRPGAMTQIGADALNRAPPDGYTLMIVTSEATMLPFLKKSYRYDPVKDFTPIALLATSWTVFAVNPKVPANTLAELIAYSKANPGRVRYGSGGVGGALHIAVEMLRLKTGADLVHVPYRGGGQAAGDAVAGQIEMVSLGLASARRRGWRAARPRPDRAAAASDVRRCPDHRRARHAGRAHGHLVRLDCPAPDARSDRRPLGARERRRREPTRLPREAVPHRLRRGMDAADRVWRLHAR
jgi:tripartite-type tricarboxylate transporter receptor subunit TctC